MNEISHTLPSRLPISNADIGAVDMDVYGAFQLCAIGILTAPATVKLSNTYFNNPGRNIIFLWTGLQLAGLLSLTVEFIRISPTPCPIDDPATSVWADSKVFYYNSTCGMMCDESVGPTSPLRGGSANNIYVIPSPHQLDFNTATLLAAACCIPAILSMLSMWIKILDGNWEKLIGKKKKKDNEPISGTNGATPIQMTSIAERIRDWLTLIEIPVFVAAVLAIIVKGEMNFWSEPVNYQTEPIASIGGFPFLKICILDARKSLTCIVPRSMGPYRRYWPRHRGLTLPNVRS